MDYEEIYPTTVAYCTYERDLEEKQTEIDNLIEENYKYVTKIEELEQNQQEAKKIIKRLMEELKKYEKFCKEFDITI